MKNKYNALNQPFGGLAQAAPRLQPTRPWWRWNGRNVHTHNGARPPRWFECPLITNGATALVAGLLGLLVTTTTAVAAGDSGSIGITTHSQTATSSVNANVILGSKFTTGASGAFTATRMQAYFATAGGNLKMAIYSDSGGNLGTKLAETAGSAISTTGWKEIALNASYGIQNNTPYWLVVLGDNATAAIAITSGGNSTNNAFKQGMSYSANPAFPNNPGAWSALGAEGLYEINAQGGGVTVDVTVTVDFGASLGAVKRGLFSINAPYLSQGELGTQGLVNQLNAMAQLNPPMLRLWDRIHPPASNPTKVFNPATDANTPYHGDMALTYTEYVNRVDAPLLFTIAQFPFGQGGYPLNNPTVRAAWIKWYTDVVVWMRSLGVDFSYIAIFNEDLFGKSAADCVPYFQFYNDLADSLRAANPGVKIGGTSEAQFWEGDYYSRFLQACGTHSDFMSRNHYGSGSSATSAESMQQDGTSFWYDGWGMRGCNDAYLPGKRLDLVITEYGLDVLCNEGGVTYRQRKGYGAAWAFSVWRGMMRANSEESLDAAFLWHFDDSGCYGSWGPQVHPPLGTLLQLLSARLQQANRFLDSSSDGTKVECLATATPNEYMIGLVNKTATNQTVGLHLLNCAPGATSQVWSVVAEDLAFPAPVNAGPVLSEQTVTLPPFSLRIVFAPRQVGDINCDGRVDMIDLTFLSEHWLELAPRQVGDINCDGRVDMIDLAFLSEHWLE